VSQVTLKGDSGHSNLGDFGVKVSRGTE